MLKDVYGNTIKRGTTIVYPARKGSDMWLTQATVTQIRESGKRFEIEAIRNGQVKQDRMTNVDTRPVKLTRTSHLLVVS